MRGDPPWPLATTTNESFVEVSPSIVIRLNDRSAAVRVRRGISAGAIAASVATKPSMVAMFGRIMPAPLAMPVTVIDFPPTSTRRDTALGWVSVVMIASAASSQWPGCSLSIAAGSPAISRSTGRGSMITPVENGRTWAGSKPRSFASASHVVRAASRPASPVPAFALPVLTTSARTPAPAARCSRQTVTGAAQKRLRVKTPPTDAPSATRTTRTSLRLAFRIPASAQPSSTPATGKSSSRRGNGKLTGIAVR